MIEINEIIPGMMFQGYTRKKLFIWDDENCRSSTVLTIIAAEERKDTTWLPVFCQWAQTIVALTSDGEVVHSQMYCYKREDRDQRFIYRIYYQVESDEVFDLMLD